jgi:hypothetical protein
MHKDMHEEQEDLEDEMPGQPSGQFFWEVLKKESSWRKWY